LTSPLVEAAESGDRRRALEEGRDFLARTIVIAETSNVAALMKQLRDTMTELDAIPDGGEVDAVDELAARRPPPPEVRKRTTRKAK
jgi:hypothetical protein